jgi:hypothetical protein
VKCGWERSILDRGEGAENGICQESHSGATAADAGGRVSERSEAEECPGVRSVVGGPKKKERSRGTKAEGDRTEVRRGTGRWPEAEKAETGRMEEQNRNRTEVGTEVGGKNKETEGQKGQTGGRRSENRMEKQRGGQRPKVARDRGTEVKAGAWLGPFGVGAQGAYWQPGSRVCTWWPGTGSYQLDKIQIGLRGARLGIKTHLAK